MFVFGALALARWMVRVDQAELCSADPHAFIRAIAAVICILNTFGVNWHPLGRLFWEDVALS
jgi:hypothetical protein